MVYWWVGEVGGEGRQGVKRNTAGGGEVGRGVAGRPWREQQQ